MLGTSMVSSGLASCVSAQAYFQLDLFGMLRRRAQRDGNVIGHLITGDRDHRGMANGAAGEHCDVGGAAADVDQADAEVLSSSSSTE